jgi:hypothetical protein
LSDDDAKELLQSMIGWFILSLEDGSAPLVIRKLCSALATYFIHFSQFWPDCVSHIVRCLDLGRTIDPQDYDKAIQIDAVIASLSMTKLQGAVWFITAFVEDVGKLGFNSAKWYVDVIAS